MLQKGDLYPSGEARMLASPTRHLLRWDPYLEPSEDDMQFRLTYEGALLAHRDDKRLEQRVWHVHDLRRVFHQQLRELWVQHPVLSKKRYAETGVIGLSPFQEFHREGFRWLPLVTEDNGLICALDILMLRHGPPGGALHDIDNRLKTLFDALRMVNGPNELGANSKRGKIAPATDETPFYVLLQDDKLITHLSVTTDMILAPVPDTTATESVRLVIGVTIRPYDVQIANVPLT